MTIARLLVILLGALVAGCRSLAPPDVARQRAQILTEVIQRDFWDPAQPAYLEVAPRRTKGLPYAMMWANGVQFTVLAGAVGQGATEYAPQMAAFRTALEAYWNPRRQLYSAYLSGTDDVYYDDNQWLILAYVEAFEATGDRAYLDKATTIAEGCLAGIDEVRGGGSYWHVDTAKYPTKNTCSNAPLATALLRVRKHLTDEDQRTRYLEQAEQLLVWTRDTLQDERGLMLDNIDVKAGKITRWTFTYNTALMIEGWLELYAVTQAPAHLAEAERLAAASDHWFKPYSPTESYFDDPPFFVVHLLEALLQLHAVTGEQRWLERCRQTADSSWHRWRQDTPNKLLDLAAVARMQWLLAGPSPVPPPAPGICYVRIEAPGKERALVLGEVAVISRGRNVAPSGRACQSSTAGPDYAARAIDGASGTFSRTSGDKDNPWWELELPTRAPVEDIRISPPVSDGLTVLLLDATRHVVRPASANSP